MIMMILSLFSNDADACSPGLASFLQSSPHHFAENVPIDSIIKIELGQGYLFDTPEVTVRQGEMIVEVDISIHSRTLDLVAQHIMLEVTPLAELAPNSQYTVEIQGLSESETIEFVTGEHHSETIDLVPVTYWSEYVFSRPSQESQSSCDGSSTTELFMDFNDDLITDSDYSLNLYRISADLADSERAISEEDLHERFLTILHAIWLEMSTP